MASHTIQDAMKLTGKGRMTLYRYMNAGKLAYTVGMDDRRYIDTAELIRVYGELKPVVQETVPEKAKPIDTTNDLLRRLVDEVQQLRRENREQAAQLEAIREQLEARPLLEAPVPVEQEQEPPVETEHSYSGLIASLKAKQAD